VVGPPSCDARHVETTQLSPIVQRLEFLVDEAEKISHGAVEVLVELGDPLGTNAVIALIDGCETWQAGENYFLFRALGEIGGEHAFQRLAQEVENREPEAVWPLARTGDPRAIDRLIQRLGDHDAAAITDSDARGVSNAADALAYLGDPRAVEPLIAVLQGTAKAPVAAEPFYPAETRRKTMLLRVIRALGKLGDSRAIPEVQRLRVDQPREIEDEADWALKDLESRQEAAIWPRPDGSA
jgi:HEAT repeat protein